MYDKRVTQDKVEISDDPRETNRHVAFIGCIQKLSDPSNSTDEHKKNTVRCFLHENHLSILYNFVFELLYLTYESSCKNKISTKYNFWRGFLITAFQEHEQLQFLFLKTTLATLLQTIMQVYTYKKQREK